MKLNRLIMVSLVGISLSTPAWACDHGSGGLLSFFHHSDDDHDKDRDSHHDHDKDHNGDSHGNCSGSSGSGGSGSTTPKKGTP